MKFNPGQPPTYESLFPVLINQTTCLFGKNFGFDIFNDGVSGMIQVWSYYDKAFIDAAEIRGEISSVVIQKCLCIICHSGFNPESSVFRLDSRIRGEDGLGIFIKKC
jgi:hypothetical protein